MIALQTKTAMADGWIRALMMVFLLVTPVAGITQERSESVLENEVRQDIEDLHDFFVGWYNGTLPESAFETEFLARLDPAFTIIMPSGVELDYETLSSAMRTSFGGNEGFRIQIRNVRLVHVTESTAVATYEEWQRREQGGAEPGSARISTVTLARRDRLKWLHVQETWLPDEIIKADLFNF